MDSLVPTGTLRSLSVTSPGFTFRDEDVSLKRFIWINKLLDETPLCLVSADFHPLIPSEFLFYEDVH